MLPSENDTVIGGNCPKCGGNFIDCNCQEFKETPLQQASKIYKKTVQHKTEFGNMSDLDFIAGANWQAKIMYTEEDMLSFAEFVATYQDKNRNVNGEILHAKSKYDGAERTIDLFDEWFKQFKNK
jgi:hypothetical protein